MRQIGLLCERIFLSNCVRFAFLARPLPTRADPSRTPPAHLNRSKAAHLDLLIALHVAGHRVQQEHDDSLRQVVSVVML